MQTISEQVVLTDSSLSTSTSLCNDFKTTAHERRGVHWEKVFDFASAI